MEYAGDLIKKKKKKKEKPARKFVHCCARVGKNMADTMFEDARYIFIDIILIFNNKC